MITEIDDGTLRYEDTFWDATADGPVNIWKQMFDYATKHGYKVRVSSIHFESMYSPMAGEEDKVVGFKMIGELYR